MCCIIYKPKGVEIPDFVLLDRIRRVNHDGYGFVSTNHRFKGLDYGKFLHHLLNVRKNEECIIHYRLATHGTICRDNCHPFVQGDVYFAHNGILDVRPAGNMTDSETAFREIIYPLIVRNGLRSRYTKRVINSIRGCSKFAIMQNNSVYLFGDFEQINGLYYSNIRWLCH